MKYLIAVIILAIGLAAWMVVADSRMPDDCQRSCAKACTAPALSSIPN